MRPAFLLLLLLMLCGLRHAQSTQHATLMSLGVRCATTDECDTKLRDTACHYRYVACLSGSCRALPALPCRNATTPRPCNALDAQCRLKRCHSTQHCDTRAHCDGRELCLGSFCVFETLDSYCRTLNETCTPQGLCAKPPTARPTPMPARPTTPPPTTAVVREQSFQAADNTSNTTAPTAAPTAPNVPVYGVWLLGVMLFVFLVVLIVAMLTRNTPLYIVSANSQGDGQIRYVY